MADIEIVVGNDYWVDLGRMTFLVTVIQLDEENGIAQVRWVDWPAYPLDFISVEAFVTGRRRRRATRRYQPGDDEHEAKRRRGNGSGGGGGSGGSGAGPPGTAAGGGEINTCNGLYAAASA